MPKSAKQIDREIDAALQRSKPKPRHHATRQAGRKQIDALIASSDPEEWSVARDLALQQNDRRLIALLDMARALDVPPSDLKVAAWRPAWRPFPKIAFEVRLGSSEYVVVPDEAAARKIALEHVEDDLKNEPKIFSESLIERHINQKALKKWVHDAQMEDDYVDELARHQVDDFWGLAKQLDVDKAVPDTDEDGNLMEPTQKQLAAVKRAYAGRYDKKPMDYFEDMYSHEDAVKAALKAAGFDVKDAAKDAVDTDGWQHFLAGYDGESHETDSGLVYWRVN